MCKFWLYITMSEKIKCQESFWPFEKFDLHDDTFNHLFCRLTFKFLLLVFDKVNSLTEMDKIWNNKVLLLFLNNPESETFVQNLQCCPVLLDTIDYIFDFFFAKIPLIYWCRIWFEFGQTCLARSHRQINYLNINISTYW